MAIKSMKKSYLIATIILLAIFIASVFIWQKQKQSVVQEQKNQEETLVQINAEQSIDTSDWKTYRNEEYGFEVRYPDSWVAEESFTAGIGIPVDCEKKSEQCHIFSIRFSQEGAARNPIMLEVYDSDTLDKSGDFYQRGTIKNTTYFPIFGSCYAQVSVSGKKRLFHFYSLYELPGDSGSSDAEQFCSNGIPDEIFDGIVESFLIGTASGISD